MSSINMELRLGRNLLRKLAEKPLSICSLHFHMISTILIIDTKGEILANRKYRDDFNEQDIDTYRLSYVAAKELTTPCVVINETSFLCHVHHETYYVAITRKNANATLIFQFLAKLPGILFKVIGLPDLKSSTIKQHTPDVMELLDEMIDGGYPQNTDYESLRLLTQRQSRSEGVVGTEKQVTIMATGAVTWRPAKIFYRINELYVYVIEHVNMLINSTGKILDSSVSGQIIMKVYLSGMPECKIGFNDKITGGQSNSMVTSQKQIQVNDMVFHQCVKLTNFAEERAISFIPPDGEFELMKYNITDHIPEPFIVTPLLHDLPGNALDIRINIRSKFKSNISATPVVMKIPMPDNASDIKITSTLGIGKYVPSKNAVVWKSKNFPGKTEAGILIRVKCLASITNSSPSTRLKDPISVDFNVQSLSASGLRIRYLKVLEKTGYHCDKWLRHVTKAGKYEVRIV